MKIAIIGGGFTGLSAAYRLTQAGNAVTLFEKEKTLGGLVYGFREKGWDWHLEYAYHHLFTNDSTILKLCRELEVDVITKRPVTANFTTNSVFQLDSPAKLLTYPKLSIVSRTRTAALLGFIKAIPFWQPFEHFTAKDVFERVGGEEAWDHLWGPLMAGKFGPYADRVAASWLWARIKKRTRELAYIAGGFHTLVTKLERKILEQGGTIYTNTEVDAIDTRYNHNSRLKLFRRKVSRNADQSNNEHLGFEVRFNSKKSYFDKVLITAPTPLAVKLVPELRDELRASLTIPHLFAQTLIVETKEPILRDVYWLNILDRSFPFLAAVAHTNFMDSKHYGGHHLTYFGNYLPEGHKYLSMTKEKILKEFFPYIQKLNLQWSSNVIAQSYLFTGPFAQPVHEVDYCQKAPRLVTTIPGLYLANIDSICPWDRGTNYAVELGEKSAELITRS